MLTIRCFSGSSQGCLLPRSGADSWRAWLQELPGSFSSGVTLTSAQASPPRYSICTDLQLAPCSADPCSHTEGQESGLHSLHEGLDSTTSMKASSHKAEQSHNIDSLSLWLTCHMTCYSGGALAEFAPDEGPTSALKGRDACVVKGLANWKLTWLPLLSGRASLARLPACPALEAPLSLSPFWAPAGLPWAASCPGCPCPACPETLDGGVMPERLLLPCISAESPEERPRSASLGCSITLSRTGDALVRPSARREAEADLGMPGSGSGAPAPVWAAAAGGRGGIQTPALPEALRLLFASGLLACSHDAQCLGQVILNCKISYTLAVAVGREQQCC